MKKLIFVLLMMVSSISFAATDLGQNSSNTNTPIYTADSASFSGSKIVNTRFCEKHCWVGPQGARHCERRCN